VLRHNAQDGPVENVSTSQPGRIASEWLAEGRRVVAATLIDRIGSSPLDPGAEMFFDDRGRVEGTVTGGCVESALAEEAGEVFDGGAPRIVSYGVSDGEAASVGLMCGGTVRVFLSELKPEFNAALSAATRARDRGEPVAVATLLAGPDAGSKLTVTVQGTVGSLGIDLLDHNVERESHGFVDEGTSRVRSYGSGGEVMGDDLPVFFQSFQRPPEMLIYGAIDYSVALARIAREIGYRVSICDARPPFAAGRRFAEVAEVVVDWPDDDLKDRKLGSRDAVLVFTHDPKFDEPALIGALASGAGYIGALGSRKTHSDRVERLRQAGVDDDRLARIHAPCGLDLGARTPEETAISILAEIVASRTGRGGEPLRDSDLPIHAGG
jgi:xanthine dehydrogenase accessory factor